MVIRPEAPQDASGIRDVNRLAFGQEHEGRIVDELRANDGILLSLVAVRHGRIVGHALYSPALLGDLTGGAVGPMAVSPDEQRQGIGTRLIETGNAALFRDGCPFIVVLGHPAFYPRFGFEPASRHGMTCAWEVPDEAFMVIVLDHARVRGVVPGLVQYRPEFMGA